jgi:fumarate reductase subunit C
VTSPLRSGDAAAGLDGAAAAPAQVRTYPFRQPFDWWLRRRGYVLYMVRELTAVPIAAWWVLFLVELARMRQGAAGYQPFEGPVFAVVSLLCLAAALWHSYTFLSFAGIIMRIPLGDRFVAPRTIAGAAFGGFAVLTAVVAALLIWGGA